MSIPFSLYDLTECIAKEVTTLSFLLQKFYRIRVHPDMPITVQTGVRWNSPSTHRYILFSFIQFAVNESKISLTDSSFVICDTPCPAHNDCNTEWAYSLAAPRISFVHSFSIGKGNEEISFY